MLKILTNSAKFKFDSLETVILWCTEPSTQHENWLSESQHEKPTPIVQKRKNSQIMVETTLFIRLIHDIKHDSSLKERNSVEQ